MNDDELRLNLAMQAVLMERLVEDQPTLRAVAAETDEALALIGNTMTDLLDMVRGPRTKETAAQACLAAAQALHTVTSTVHAAVRIVELGYDTDPEEPEMRTLPEAVLHLRDGTAGCHPATAGYEILTVAAEILDGILLELEME